QQFDDSAARNFVPACPTPVPGEGSSAGWEAIALVELPSGPATVFADPSATRLLVVDDADCSVLLDRTR
ncbi:MAG TPA: hypothetical protein VIY72_12685, partial [Acidimicrobiales bacterium]